MAEKTIIDQYVQAKIRVNLLDEELKLAKQEAEKLETEVIDWMTDNNTLQIRTPAGLVSYAPQTWVSPKNVDQLTAALEAHPEFEQFDGIRKLSYDSRSLSARYREAIKSGATIPTEILDTLNITEKPKTKFTPAKESQ